MSKINKSNSYAEIIRNHAIETRKGCRDEAAMVHTIMALYVTSNPEHKNAIKARNFLEWVNGQSFNAIPRAYAAIKDLIAAGLATFAPTQFVSDGRDTSRIIPPYPYLCSPNQIQRYSTDNQFWTDL